MYKYIQTYKYKNMYDTCSYILIIYVLLVVTSLTARCSAIAKF